MSPDATNRTPFAFDVRVAPLVPTPDFLAQCKDYGLVFEEGDLARLGLYLALLLEATKQFNLTTITDPAHAWLRHIFDSLTLLGPLSDVPESGRIVDIGSGGGLPGIPLAICRPDLRFTLIESTGKKATFLRTITNLIALDNVTILCARAEDIAHDRQDHREQYDAVLARAVGKLSIIAELTIPFAKAPSQSSAGGFTLLIKGQKADDELGEAKQALYLLHARHEMTIDTPTGRIVVLAKTRQTPRIYPRKPGEPKRKPLGGFKR